MNHGAILALDLATTTGWCVGSPGEMPRCGTIKFGKEGASGDAIFGHALRWLSDFLLPHPRPDSIIMEAMLPPTAMKGQTSTATRDRLAGLHGVMRAVAHCRGIYEISTVSVLAVRHHFCGARSAGKYAVYDQCRALGYPVNGLDAADACATWHFACSLILPQMALEVSPLFRKRGYGVSA